MDYESLLLGLINTRLTKEVNQSQQIQQREDRRMPNSTRRAFESQMKTDAAVSRVAAQNMEDGKAMVNVAQTNATAIRTQFQEIEKIMAEFANSDSMSLLNYEQANTGIEDRINEIQRLVENASFNGIKLMDGSAGEQHDGNVDLMAANSVRTQHLVNLKDGSGVGLSGSSMDLQHGTLFQTGELKLDTSSVAAAKASAEAGLTRVRDYIESLVSLESKYSNDYKALDNLSILFEEQADIFEAAGERASASPSLSRSAILSQILNSSNSSILTGNT